MEEPGFLLDYMDQSAKYDSSSYSLGLSLQNLQHFTDKRTTSIRQNIILAKVRNCSSLNEAIAICKTYLLTRTSMWLWHLPSKSIFFYWQGIPPNLATKDLSQFCTGHFLQKQDVDIDGCAPCCIMRCQGMLQPAQDHPYKSLFSPHQCIHLLYLIESSLFQAGFLY